MKEKHFKFVNKLLTLFPLLLIITLSKVLPVTACWAAPEPFEIFSADKTRVFVFKPDDNHMDNAEAAVYDVVGNERVLVYKVEDLSSFAFESNFHFSADMEHFVRTFNPSGLPVFEVFSNGIRTRTVYRYNFISYFDSIESETSIGPMYIVNWRFENVQDAIITIATDEGNVFSFDMVTAEFLADMGEYLEYHSQTSGTPLISSQNLTISNDIVIDQSIVEPYIDVIFTNEADLAALLVPEPIDLPVDQPTNNPAPINEFPLFAIVSITLAIVAVISLGLVYFLTKKSR